MDRVGELKAISTGKRIWKRGYQLSFKTHLRYGILRIWALVSNPPHDSQPIVFRYEDDLEPRDGELKDSCEISYISVKEAAIKVTVQQNHYNTMRTQSLTKSMTEDRLLCLFPLSIRSRVDHARGWDRSARHKDRE